MRVHLLQGACPIKTEIMGCAGRLVGACLLASLLQAALATKLQVCSLLSMIERNRLLRLPLAGGHCPTAVANRRPAPPAPLLPLERAPHPSLLQWNITGPYVNFPFGSGQPPFMLRTVEGDAPDQVVVVTANTGGGWQLSSYKADTGGLLWEWQCTKAANLRSKRLTSLSCGRRACRQRQGLGHRLHLACMSCHHAVTCLPWPAAERALLLPLQGTAYGTPQSVPPEPPMVRSTG